jgi:hypothetical protein
MNDAAPMATWNGVLRFVLELVGLAGIVVGGWSLATGTWRSVPALGLGLVAAFAWGRYRVPNDPGPAPVAIAGRVRLALEAVVLVAGGIGWLIGGHPVLSAGYAMAVVFHYLTSLDRVRWLLQHT